MEEVTFTQNLKDTEESLFQAEEAGSECTRAWTLGKQKKTRMSGSERAAQVTSQGELELKASEELGLFS